ncbi:ADP-ribose diphosphatase [Schizosaccharomyces cryophilus OY26]|uniref:ADP-ribose diphosphatase n=1 Tax=Schizosaccharomyces cryophilus (strain OY26 / ATCC MYA-4695 / CBS 11777 / NBRC 106824 / NRRL Y48691) TaxID=653667 RepID=S9W2R3_SCHCR|nr:ADP-ribose diphosphatase [Schizosaccharomyces cryophilus OY26]EPY54318.1 ADP-ribose diphosphatase [Schizosaccharomyces cryophilus OY26]
MSWFHFKHASSSLPNVCHSSFLIATTTSFPFKRGCIFVNCIQKQKAQFSSTRRICNRLFEKRKTYLLPTYLSTCDSIPSTYSHYTTMSQEQEPKVLEVSDLETKDAKWTSLKKITWQDQSGKTRAWEMAERTTRSKSGIDAVAILGIIPIDGEPHVLCQKQYRPPLGKICIEIPAGLVDSNESPEDSAIRELREETGFVGSVKEATTVMYNDPGLTNANLKIILVDIDMSKPENQNPQQRLDQGEYITNFPIKLSSLQDELFSLEHQGFAVDVRLSTFALGMQAALKYLVK